MLIALGTAAVAFPLVATLAVALVLGWVLLLAGIVQAVHTFRTRLWRGFLLQTLGAALTLAVAALLLLFPQPSIASLTLLLGVFFAVEGLLRAALAWQLRRLPAWGWMLAGGIVSLLLGALVLLQWQQVAAWLLGLLVGIDLVLAGWALVALALAAGRARR